MTRNDLKEKLKQDVRQAIIDYRQAFLDGDYIKMGTTGILRYAKKGLIKTVDGDICLWEKSHEAYPILRLGQQGKLELNESCMYVL